MQPDDQWPGQQPGDLATYTAASSIISGGDASLYAVLPLERYGRWQAVVRELFDAHQEGGHAAAFGRYLQIVYRDAEFALLMATLGMQSPVHPWQPAELPNRNKVTMQSFLAAPTAPPLPPPLAPAQPKASPRGRLPKNWSLMELLAGHYDDLPARRHAVREEQVYAALRELGEATVSELARHTDQDRSNVHRRVQKLLEQGQIERLVTRRAIVYRVRA